MSLTIISAIIYLANCAFSVLVALIIINKLYISKKFTKEHDFHLYNDLFSWEMFFIFIGIATLTTVLSILIPLTTEIAYLFFKIRLFSLFFAFWIKIIHLEKVMDKLTYERHYVAGVIPCIFTLIFFLIDIPRLILIIIFLGTSVIPYLILVFLYKNTSTLNKKSMKIIVGAIFLIMGFVLVPELIENYFKATLLENNITIISPILCIIGDLVIFDSFRKDLK